MFGRFWNGKGRYSGLAAIFLICGAQAPIDWAVRAGWVVFAHRDNGLLAYFYPAPFRRRAACARAKYFTMADKRRIFFVEMDCPHRTMRVISYGEINAQTGGYIATHNMRDYPAGFIPPEHPVNFLSQKLC